MHHQGTAKKVVDGYKEAYGRDKSIVSLEVIGDVTDVDGNNNVIDDVVDEESQMVDELGSHDQPINSMKCTGERCPPKRQLFTATPIRPQNEEHNEQSTPGDQTPHTRKRRRVQQEPPEWFQAFRAEQNERMDRLEAANNSLIKIAQERNDILKTLVNHLTKNK
ncbi:hypothetical protein MAR_002650 [Mya arenaria]|uniref:Uncharacterized protein n=1 Tax=Mya arenaria TaxID=6604 RepID=A0ABY7G6Z9_MYAAR|nr:hypothetical protein MAR_002650 [Mya arenaria]